MLDHTWRTTVHGDRYVTGIVPGLGLVNKWVARLNSSRMRTARALTVSLSMLCAGGGSAWSGGPGLGVPGLGGAWSGGARGVPGPRGCLVPGGGPRGVPGPRGGWYPVMH